MKNYSSNRAQKGKTAFRTPDRVRAETKMKGRPVRYRFGLISRQVKQKSV